MKTKTLIQLFYTWNKDGMEPYTSVKFGPQYKGLELNFSGGYVYIFCGGVAPFVEGHAPDCVWLRAIKEFEDNDNETKQG